MRAITLLCLLAILFGLPETQGHGSRQNADTGSGEQKRKAALAKESGLLKKLAERVAKDGQTSPPDANVNSFLSLGGKTVIWHSEFDLERQIQLYRHSKSGPARLIFLVPEKPFPEFGKTWVHCLTLDGKDLKSGVQEPRAPFVDLKNEKNAQAQCLKEIRHWAKYFKLEK